MLEQILELDTELLLFFNGFHSEYFDWFMSMLTRREVWLPLYLAIVYVIFKGKGREAFFALLFLLLVPVFADLLNQHIFKPYFDRLRPFHVEELKNQLHVFNYIAVGVGGFLFSHLFGFSLPRRYFGGNECWYIFRLVALSCL